MYVYNIRYKYKLKRHLLFFFSTNIIDETVYIICIIYVSYKSKLVNCHI